MLKRWRRIATLVLVLLAVGASSGRAEESWIPVRSGKLRGIGGMVLVEEKGGPMVFVIAHDNKAPDQQRLALLTVVEDRASYSRAIWPETVAEPVDIEALQRVPRAPDDRYWAMTSLGAVTELRLVENRRVVEVIRQFQLPDTRDGENYEGLALSWVDDVPVVAWGARGGGASPGRLYWGMPRNDTVEVVGSADVTVPWPTGGNVRHLSDLALDEAGILYLSAAEDPGDNGPFNGVIYRAGRFTIADGRPVFEPAFEELARAPGQKIEALALIPGPAPRLACGTDNENGGSTVRLYELR